MTSTDDECVSYARECVRLAGLTEDPEIRDQLLGMARNWMAEAMQEGRKEFAKPPLRRPKSGFGKVMES